MATCKQLLYIPPEPQPIPSKKPEAEEYFMPRILVWRPRRLWQVELKCQHCDARMTSKGWYKTVRTVIALREVYYLVTEYVECRKCKKAYPAYTTHLMKQLDVALRMQFPVILTYKSACDREIVACLRGRTLGNSPNAIHRAIREMHTETWIVKTTLYLYHCKVYQGTIRGFLQKGSCTFLDPPQLPHIPGAAWVLSVMGIDAHSRLQETRCSITSVFGRVLKLVSTKKIVRKLAGESRGTATWCTNIGNEFGEILNSVLTVDEGEGLRRMSQGIVSRYQRADVRQPQVIYVDRGCCRKADKTCHTQELFAPWTSVVKLDIFHFMNRFHECVNSESHPAFELFMAKLSAAIFVCDADDLALLQRTKRSELQSKGTLEPTLHQVNNAITTRELQAHCKRKTRGSVETEAMIDELFKEVQNVTDLVGVPLINHDRANDVWGNQKKHLSCIQDPPGVTLYTNVGVLNKLGVALPVYRCARGSSSLESFHLHLARFVPGTSANAENFQMYLLEGIARWNTD